jgi:tRNA pseudouridine38-40 synthase
MDPGALARELNDRLPHDIHVLRADRARDGFHARRDAVGRVYLYQISRRRTAFAKPFVWWIRDELDAVAMARAARDAVGRHDFSAFADRRAPEGESKIVVVESCAVGEAGDLILVRMAASHFLWKMVRKVVALLVEVGRGRERPAALRDRLQRGAEPLEPAAPPSGLFLEAVLYPGDRFTRGLEPPSIVRSPPPG